jgi:molybdate transport system substrate-binding protein
VKPRVAVVAARRSRFALALTATLAALSLSAAACGGDDSDSASRPEEPLVVSAAASLSEALRACSPEGTRLSFAGSDELAAQIRQGVKPGVFAAANTKLPEDLRAEGLVQEPRVFATNELVIAVPADSDVRAIEDLADDGVTVAVGATSVPVGSYTREVLGRLPGAQRQAIENNVRTREPDVKGVVGKVSQGAADAGFVYATDVTAAGDDLRAVRLPSSLQPRIAYAAAVVARSAPADRYLADLVGGRCQDALREAGFGAP